MKSITVREFRASVAHIKEPVRVGKGIWFPESTPVLEAIGDGTAVLGTGVEVAVRKQDDDKYVFVVQKERSE